MDTKDKGSKKKSSNGRWSKTQHDRFMSALQKFGRDWVSVQKFVKTRTLSQVRSHAQKVFMKMSESDIDALISGEGQSDYENQYQRETVKNKPILRKKSQRNIQSKGKSKQSLLDIFKRAIQLQTLQIYNESKTPMHQNISEFHNQPQKSQTSEQPSSVCIIPETLLCKNISEICETNKNSRIPLNPLNQQNSLNQGYECRHQSIVKKPQTNIEPHIDFQSMEFNAPDLKLACQPPIDQMHIHTINI